MPMSRIREFPLPDLGEGLTEGEILKWLVSEGDIVALNQPIVEVETAKAAVEIPAKWAGRVTRIYHEEGSTVEVGTPIIAIDTDPDGPPIEDAPSGGGEREIPPPGGADEPGMIGGPAPGGRTAVLVGYGPRNGAAVRRPRKAPAGGTRPTEAPRPAEPARPAPAGAYQTAAVAAPAAPVAPATPAAPAARSSERVLAKPPVRKLARDLGVDLTGIVGTGPAGSITREDVQAAVSAAAERPAVSAPSFGPEREQRIPVRGVRKLTAENMVASAFTAPHVTEFLPVDVTRSVRALGRLRARPGWKGVRLSLRLLVAKAVLLAIRRDPMVNSPW